jgi:hypothetical protein
MEAGTGMGKNKIDWIIQYPFNTIDGLIVAGYRPLPTGVHFG